MSEFNRPFGVALLALLALLSGLVFLASSLGFFGTALLADEGALVTELGDDTPQWVVDNYVVFFTALGALTLLLAVLFFAATRGLLRGREWAWTLAVVVTVLSVVSNILGIYAQGLDDPVVLADSAVGFVFAVLILGYLLTKRVRRFFGKL
jgi:uncharacterized BrkB/YihY/UPF0761 family membrane protein